MNIVFPDDIDIPAHYQDKLAEVGVQQFHDNPTSDQLKERIKDANVICANYYDATSEIIDSAKNLQYIISPAVGYDWIDIGYAKTKGIQIVNCPTFNSLAVAEHAVALIFALKRKILESNHSLCKGDWAPTQFMGSELSDKTYGLIGHGKIGRNIERILSSFNSNVTYVDSRSSQDEVDQLVSSSDCIIICAQLNQQTQGMIDGRRLNLMKNDAIIVNVARGAIVDQKALVEVLELKRIAGAALDVFDDEPLKGKAPDKIIEIASMDNVLATPHIGYNTLESATRLGQELLDNVEAIIQKKAINVVEA